MPRGAKRDTRLVTIVAVIAVFLAIALPVAIVAFTLARSASQTALRENDSTPVIANISILVPFFVACVVLAAVVLTAIMLRTSRQPRKTR